MSKKLLSLLLALMMCLSLCTPIWAEQPDAEALSSLASQYILIEKTADETTYSNLQGFYTAVQERHLEISNDVLAAFTFSYTRPDTAFLLETLSQEELLDILTAISVTTHSEIMRVSCDGSVCTATAREIQELSGQNAALHPNGISVTSDGYIKFTTTSTQKSMVGTDRRYTLSVTARWLVFPSERYTDTLAITYGGTFDDTKTVTARHVNYGTCSYCGEDKRVDEVSSYGIPASGSTPQQLESSSRMSLDFSQGAAVGVRTTLPHLSCRHSNNNGTPIDYFEDSSMYTCLEMGILVSDTTETRAAYAHTKRNISVGISASVSPTGVTPSFSVTSASKTVNYTAPPLTLTVY